MSTFEFLFSLFGLLLGFSIAEIAGGFSRAYDRRKTRPIGWLAPALAALLVIDLLSFWYGAWFLRDMELKFWLMLLAAVIGLLYYFAATQIFPREGSQTSPTEHVMHHKAPVAISVVVANLIMFGPKYVTAPFVGNAELLLSWSFFTTLFYVILLCGVAFLRSRKLVLVCIVLSIVVLLGSFAIVDY